MKEKKNIKNNKKIKKLKIIVTQGILEQKIFHICIFF